MRCLRVDLMDQWSVVDRQAPGVAQLRIAGDHAADDPAKVVLTDISKNNDKMRFIKNIKRMPRRAMTVVGHLSLFRYRAQ